MEIKRNLKVLDVKLSKLASELGVSRPTLDAYIDYYEKGQPIPNEGYQRIFEYLFSGEKVDSVDFACRYDFVKRVMLADAKAGAEKKAESKKQAATIKNIEDVLASGILEPSMIDFINLFINNKEKDLVQAICMYFSITNGYMNMTESDFEDKDKALFSQLAKVFSEYQADRIEFMSEYYEQILLKNKELFDRKKIKVNDSDIIEYIKSNLGKSNELDLEELKKMIELREDK